jgi:hypothetical protein
MCDYEKIKGIISDEVKPMNEAIIKLTSSTEVLQGNVTKLEEAQVKFYEMYGDQKGIAKDIAHIKEKEGTNRKDIDVLYGMMRDHTKEVTDKFDSLKNEGISKMFAVLMVIFSGVLGAGLSSIVWALR